jgi:regulator of protease activity HflC (stomatin/prohibitin superfamily)
MKHLFLLIMPLPLGFLAAWVGWPWLIVVVSLTVAVYGYLLLKGFPIWRPAVVYSTFFVAETLFIGWVAFGILQSINPDDLSPQVVPWYQFAFGTDLLMRYWAMVGGVSSAIFLFAVVVLPLTWARVPALGKMKGQTRMGVFLRALRRTLGLVPAEWKVREGTITTLKPPQAPHHPLTGPGEVEVQQGNVVLVEQSGAVTRLLGTGVHAIGHDEVLGMVIPLYGRADTVEIDNIVTHDGLIIERLELTIFHKVHAGDANDQTENGLFPYCETILREQIWSASGKDWREGIQAVTGREARNLISDYTLEEFLTLTSDDRNEFKKLLEPRVNAVTKNLMGVGVTVTGIGVIRLPAKAVEKLTERWTAEKDHEIETETAGGRKDAFNLLFGAMRDALKEQPAIKDLLVMSFIERMEHAQGQAEGGMGSDLDTLAKIYLLEALKGLSTQESPSHSQAREDVVGSS